MSIVSGSAARPSCGCELQAVRDPAAQARRDGLRRAGGRVDQQPVAQHRAEKIVGAQRDLHRDARSARRARTGAEHELVGAQVGACRQQLHRRVGMGHAARPVFGEQQRADRLGVGRVAAAREQAAELERRRMDQHDLAGRCGLDDGAQERRGRAGRIDIARRQAARGEVRDPLGQRLDAGGELEQRFVGGRCGLLGSVDHQRADTALGKSGAQAFEHQAAEADMRIRDHGHEVRLRVREQAPQPVGLVVGRKTGHRVGGSVRDVRRAARRALHRHDARP